MLYPAQDLNAFFTCAYLNELLYFIKINMTRCVYSTETQAKYVHTRDVFSNIFAHLIYMIRAFIF